MVKIYHEHIAKVMQIVHKCKWKRRDRCIGVAYFEKFVVCFSKLKELAYICKRKTLTIEAMELKRLPVGIQTYEEIVNLNCLYVDKTEYVYKMINLSKYIR